MNNLEELMNQRFDVFRRESEHFIIWVGTAENFHDAGNLIRMDSESAKIPEDKYVVVHSTCGTTEAKKPLFESYVTLRHS